MSLLTLDAAKCVRGTNKFSQCTSCVDVCPVETIKIDEQLPSFIPNDCIGCGGCIAACPDAAYKLDDFSTINYIFSILEQKRDVLSCKESIPCLAALSTEEMLSLALLHPETLTLDHAFCAECEIAKTNEPLIAQRVEEANFILEAIESGKRLKFEDVALTPEQKEQDRRTFLSKLNVKEAIKAKQKFENEVEAGSEEKKRHAISTEGIKWLRENKDVPDRRKLLMMALKKMTKPKVFHKLDINDISFISQKILDEETCTNCQMCYRICPTGALSSDKFNSTIFFDAISCIKCASCHDVCEPDSLTLRSIFDLKELFEPNREVLAKFNVQRCDECGLPFVYRGGEKMCQRCRIEEEEAMSLWGISPEKRSF